MNCKLIKMINLSPIYKVSPDLEEIDPNSVETEEDEELYYKSLQWGCKNCDLISENRMYLTIHQCSNNGKSKYFEHQNEYMNRKLEKLKKES